jgi:hypothetical protein
MDSFLEPRFRSDSHHGARVVRGGVAFELLCERGIVPPDLGSEPSNASTVSVLCSITRGLESAPTGLRVAWEGERVTVESPGAVATVRCLAPHRYAVAARIDSDAGLASLLDAVAGAVRTRESA